MHCKCKRFIFNRLSLVLKKSKNSKLNASQFIFTSPVFLSAAVNFLAAYLSAQSHKLHRSWLPRYVCCKLEEGMRGEILQYTLEAYIPQKSAKNKTSPYIFHTSVEAVLLTAPRTHIQNHRSQSCTTVLSHPLLIYSPEKHLIQFPHRSTLELW